MSLHLYDGIETNTRALKALGIAEDSYGSLLSSVLVQRLPQELRLIAGREIEGDWNLPDILKVIGRELEARERTTTPQEDALQVEGSARRKQGKASVAMLATTNQDNSTLACCYCQGNNPPEECMTVTQIEERRRILKTSGRYFMCLKKGHIVRECRSRNRCRTCKGRHHRSICQPITPPSEPQSSPSTTKGPSRATTHLLAKSRSQLNPDAAPFQSLAASVVDKERVILLQTATVALYNPKCPESQMEGTIVFDSGSQQSYVSQAAVERHPIRRQVASIVGKVYDPLGMLSPLVTPLKVFLQDLSLTKMEWDDILPDSLLRRWTTLVEGLHPDDQVTHPRHITENTAASYRLVGFGDASQRAYAAVVYLQVEMEGRSHCQLLCSKARVTPVEKLTIPHLELLSALILARLIDRVSEAMKTVLSLEPPVCYLDSKVAY